MRSLDLKHWVNKSIAVGILSVVEFSNAWASTSVNSPFTSGLSKFKDIITGPFVFLASVILLVACFIMLAFGEWNDGFKRLIVIMTFLSAAFGAPGIVSFFFAAGAIF